MLLVDVANLEPDVLFCERARGVGDYVFEALIVVRGERGLRRN